MNKNLKQLFLVNLFLLSVALFILGSLNISYAAGQDLDTNANPERKYQIQAEDLDDNEEGDALEAKTPADKRGPGYQVLGRKLTENERELYGDLSVKELKDQLLHKEYKLVIVRALLAIGDENSVKEVLEIMPTTSDQKTFLELVDYFTKLREKHGSVLKGLQTELVDKITDEKYAFENAALKAYEEVFGIKVADEDKQQLLTYFKEHKISTFSEMVNSLVITMDAEDKKGVLMRALDDTGRPDLKENQKFVAKLLSQKFTYGNLMELFKPLKKSQPAPSKQPAKK